MPIQGEAVHQETVKRRERRWLVTLLVLPLFCLVLGLLLPFAMPIKARVGSYQVLIGTTQGQMTQVLPAGFSHQRQAAAGPVTDFEDQWYQVRGPLSISALRIRSWVYYVVWFRGHRTKKPGAE